MLHLWHRLTWFQGRAKDSNWPSRKKVHCGGSWDLSESIYELQEIAMIYIILIRLFYPHQVSVLEHMDIGLKVLECLLPSYFKVRVNIGFFWF